MSNNNKTKLSRREILMLALASGGGIGLRALLTGVPIHFLTKRSMAQAANENFLVFSSRRASDPVNANIPGTYKANYQHAGAFSNPVNMTIGDQTHQAADVWDGLRDGIKANANFFHLRSGTNSHNEQRAVLTASGGVQSPLGRGTEMIPSAISYETSKTLGTQVPNPIAINSDILSYQGRDQQIYRPTGVKGLFPGITPELQNARSFRDQMVDDLYTSVKNSGSTAQKNFLDEHIVSGNKARQLGTQLSEALAEINNNSQDNAMRVTAALLALKITPAVMVGLDFGGDNHADGNLAGEVNDHRSAIDSINLLYDSLSVYGIQDKTTFAQLNVFGRTTRRNSRGGRDHWGNASMMFSFGPNIKGGMIGDLAADNNNRYNAMGINSQTGGTNGADIESGRTLHSAAKSLMAAMGISKEKAEEMVIGGKVVDAYLK